MINLLFQARIIESLSSYIFEILNHQLQIFYRFLSLSVESAVLKSIFGRRRRHSGQRLYAPGRTAKNHRRVRDVDERQFETKATMEILRSRASRRGCQVRLEGEGFDSRLGVLEGHSFGRCQRR